METKYPHQMPIYWHVYTHDQRVWSQLLTCNSKECGRSNKLKTLKVAKWRMIDEWWRLKAERWRLGGFDNRQTDKQTFVIVELLSRLKTEEEEWGIFKKTFNMCHQFSCVHHKPYSRARHISLKGIENLIRKDYLLNILYTIIVS